MTGTPYARGNAFERRVKEALLADGYMVWQTRGSKGPADLVAAKRGQLLLVQVKGGQTGMTHDQWNALLALAQRIGALAILADRDGKAIRYRRLAGAHLPRSQDWPTAAFRPDFAGP